MLMKTLAKLGAETAGTLECLLKSQGFAYSIKNVTDEAGLDVTEFLVEEQDYERITTAVDDWNEKLSAEAEKHASRRCPTCNSPHLRYQPVEEDETSTKIPGVYECEDCGRIFAPSR